MGKRITLTEAAERARKALEDAEQRRREFNISEAREMACSECEDLEREVAQLKWQLRQGKTFFFYNIGYTTCEESCTIHCMHEEVFSEDELFQIVEDCVYDILVEHKNPGGANFEDIVHKHGPSGYSPFVKALESRGFTVPRPAKEAFVFGWASCTDPNDWSGHTYDRHKQMQANLARRLGIAKKADNGE
jgi:hypothetical protein